MLRVKNSLHNNLIWRSPPFVRLFIELEVGAEDSTFRLTILDIMYDMLGSFLYQGERWKLPWAPLLLFFFVSHRFFLYIVFYAAIIFQSSLQFSRHYREVNLYTLHGNIHVYRLHCALALELCVYSFADWQSDSSAHMECPLPHTLRLQTILKHQRRLLN